MKQKSLWSSDSLLKSSHRLPGLAGVLVLWLHYRKLEGLGSILLCPSSSSHAAGHPTGR